MEEFENYEKIMKERIKEHFTGNNWVRKVLGIFKDLIDYEEEKMSLPKKVKEKILGIGRKDIHKVTYYKKTKKYIISGEPGYGGIRFVISIRDCGEVEASVRGRRNVLWKESFQSLEGNINIPGVMKFYLDALPHLFNIRIFI